MNWLVSILLSSVGKKLMMAITGLCFCCFLVSHLIGNLTIYGGKDIFLSYVDHLHSLGPLITIAEWVLVFLAAIHILTGLTLFYKNVTARPVRYSVNKSAGGRSIGSKTMPYTGILLLMFILLHLVTFRFVDKTDLNDFQIVSSTFAHAGYVIIYIIAVIIAAIHVSHGFWSAFQTLGANHPKYMPFIRVVSIAFSVVIGAGFGSIPIFISITV